MDTLPDWLAPGTPLRVRPAKSPRAGVRLARSSLGALVRTSALLFDDGLPSGRRGALGPFDPRAKVLGLLGLLVAVTWIHGVVPLALCTGGAWLVAAVCRAPLGRMALALLAVPVFTFAVAAPATLNAVTGGEPVWVLAHLGGGRVGPWRIPEVLAVTREGLFVAARFGLRSAACVSLGALLAAVTPPQEILRGLRGLGLPSAFAMVASMTVRYLGVLLRSAEEIHLAKLSRSIAGTGVGREQAWAAAGMGEIYRRSRSLAESVALAMVSRGYTGEVRLLAPPRWRWKDGLLVAAALLAGAGLILWDRGTP